MLKFQANILTPQGPEDERSMLLRNIDTYLSATLYRNWENANTKIVTFFLLKEKTAKNK
jgi:hypothetical protein